MINYYFQFSSFGAQKLLIYFLIQKNHFMIFIVTLKTILNLKFQYALDLMANQIQIQQWMNIINLLKKFLKKWNMLYLEANSCNFLCMT